MPELSRFYNIIIRMMYSNNDRHCKPHIHVYYNEYHVSVDINGELLVGELPLKQLKLVQAWIVLHEKELYEAWDNTTNNIPIGKIDPLH